MGTGKKERTMERARRVVARMGSAALLLVVSVVPRSALAAGGASDALDLSGLISGGSSLGTSLRILLLVTIFGAVPTIVLLATCYPRLLIVLGFLRRALGTQDLPPQQVIAGLALIMTALIMMPVWQRIYAEAYLPLSRGELERPEDAFELAVTPLKDFMLPHTFRKDLHLFAELAERTARDGENRGALGTRVPPARSLEETPVEDLSFFIVLPAFVLSELKTAFQIGFLLYLPFLVIDLAVSAILLSMGMFMLPPVLVSLPLKIMVFVMVDGWNLVVGQFIEGFQPV